MLRWPSVAGDSESLLQTALEKLFLLKLLLGMGRDEAPTNILATTAVTKIDKRVY